MSAANPVRGEASIRIAGEVHTLRPSFAALVAAEEEIGPLFALVERASEGQLRLAEIATLFWHCLDPREGVTRETVGDAILAGGLAASTKPLRALLAAILQGR
ncbi:gene transfer agent family protein [Citromicrobium sp. JLT1363]|uniref:gene transfer agent family protein n=1 Tax=Citromicrobium sp. JLT1363 TaxID=517722 RepID=UPI000225E6F3|nr:gene transfer agent family protein [Citromicrobium sp. JLT1363]